MKKNSKKIFLICLTFLFVSDFFAEGSQNQKKFIKGSISDKTTSVCEASEDEAAELSCAAINFAIENKEILGEDRDLTALAVAGILSLPENYVETLSAEEKNELSEKFFQIHSIFSDFTVKIAVLNRITSLDIPHENFTKMLNSYIKTSNPNVENSALLKTSISVLSKIGNKDSFETLYSVYLDAAWNSYSSEIENAISQLSETSSEKLIELIRAGSEVECKRVFSLVMKNSQNSQIFRAEIAENVLLRAIYIVESTGSANEELISLQLDSYDVLVRQKWTRSSKTALTFFELAQKEFSQNTLHEENFVEVINGLPAVAPIEAVSALSFYLSKLNNLMEKNSNAVSEPVVLSVISSLGAIGNKNAFDTLLAVTYFNYPDSVIAAARDALAKLKW